MAGNTSISVSVNFVENNSIKLMSWKNLQKFSPKPNYTIYGYTKFKLSAGPVKTDWFFEENKKNGTVRTALKSIGISIYCTTEILIFSGIKRGSSCYKHVCDHEFKHVKLLKSSIESSRKEIFNIFQKADFPNLNKPVEVPKNKHKSYVQTRYNKLQNLHMKKMRETMAKAEKKSNSIHTSQEEKKTDKHCKSFKP